MKLIFLLFVSLLFATNCFTKSRLCEATKPEPIPVHDSTGNMLRAGANYYVQPIYPDEAWGFELASINNHHKPCPLGIVQEDYYPGTPLLFSSANPKKSIIRLSTDLNIDYNLSYTVCTKSNDVIWTVGPYDRRAKSYFLVLGGVKENPGRETIKNWFKIEVFGDNYKIRYCPSVCSDCKVMCKDVGVIEFNGQKRLGLSDVPVEVKFVKDA
ncbi:kunitz trypsin inhibitor 5-like [Lycium barbarum]|uniref:kunitz trypsin inhibitor 5-like n=2 Tax=Lycium barbarum TaxID=112863 RepID=UPI00293F7683|nr:kunitz trypsin inhibitor 5-like [Lycium barbarum]